jgi:hypothetical protein
VISAGDELNFQGQVNKIHSEFGEVSSFFFCFNSIKFYRLRKKGTTMLGFSQGAQLHTGPEAMRKSLVRDAIANCR